MEPFGKEHLRLARRWVYPGQRYLKLSGRSAFVLPRWRQRWFQWRLRYDGRRIPADALERLMVEGCWRELVAATWLVAAGQRADLRPVIKRELLGDEPCGLRWDYCSALASLGTEDDARILAEYLDRALLIRPAEDGGRTQCQPQALAALMYLDEQLGTDHAARFLGEDGPWERWPGSVGAWLEGERDEIRLDVVLASGADPGVRRMLQA
ncbi:DUF6000 family protein [Kribbella sp. NPDC051770]|uniref:DUF6000 family protein n=1 Tax=Kribbella sp. NPDC051770 TaxID=3155413 RepID=UPI00342E7F74